MGRRSKREAKEGSKREDKPVEAKEKPKKAGSLIAKEGRQASRDLAAAKEKTRMETMKAKPVVPRGIETPSDLENAAARESTRNFMADHFQQQQDLLREALYCFMNDRAQEYWEKGADEDSKEGRLKLMEGQFSDWLSVTDRTEKTAVKTKEGEIVFHVLRTRTMQAWHLRDKGLTREVEELFLQCCGGDLVIAHEVQKCIFDELKKSCRGVQGGRWHKVRKGTKVPVLTGVVEQEGDAERCSSLGGDEG